MSGRQFRRCLPILFIDVDDTLIRWSEDEGFWAKPEPNQAVIFYALAWKEANPEGVVCVWSLGGKAYAEQWRDRLLPWAEAMERYPRVPGSFELYIDDMPFSEYGSHCIHPRDIEGIL